MGIILAYILNPLVLKLEDIGLGHLISVLIALLLSLCFFLGGFIFLIPVLLDQLNDIFLKISLIYEKVLYFIEETFSGLINYDNYSVSIKNILTDKSGEILSIIPIIHKLENDKSINKILITSSTTSSAVVFSKYIIPILSILQNFKTFFSMIIE